MGLGLNFLILALNRTQLRNAHPIFLWEKFFLERWVCTGLDEETFIFPVSVWRSRESLESRVRDWIPRKTSFLGLERLTSSLDRIVESNSNFPQPILEHLDTNQRAQVSIWSPNRGVPRILFLRAIFWLLLTRHSWVQWCWYSTCFSRDWAEHVRTRTRRISSGWTQGSKSVLLALS